MSQIHSQLVEDCLIIGKMPLCHLLLMLDANYPWFILVPDRNGIQEIYELSVADQQQLLVESSRLGKAVMYGFRGHKLNIAALGNVVPQLHIHHIVRYETDPAWPAPVWGRIAPRIYEPELQEQVISILKQNLKEEIEYRV